MAEILNFAKEYGVLHWHSKSNRPYILKANPLHTVAECLEIYEQPNNSWMKTPILKEDFYKWTL